MAVSFLPEYKQIGAASIYLLAVLRIGQGLALGGAWDGLASLLALNAPVERRGLYAAIAQLGAPLGFIVAAVLFSFFLLNLSEFRLPGLGLAIPVLLRVRHQCGRRVLALTSRRH